MSPPKDGRPVRLFRAALKYLLLFFLIAGIRSAFTSEIESGGDAVRAWMASEEIARDLSVLTRDHHAARWSVNFPAALVQKIFSQEPFAYYLLPLAYFSIMFLLLLRMMKPVLSPAFLLLFGVVLFADPMLYRASSQLKPFCFGVVYSLLALGCMIKYLSGSKKRYLVGVALGCFLAYGAKIPYAFFLPGLLFYLILRKDVKAALFTAACFLLFVGAETLLFNYLSGGELVFGRLEVVGGTEGVARRYANRTDGYRTSENDMLLHLLKWIDTPLPNFMTAIAGFVTAFFITFRSDRLKQNPVVVLAALMVLSYCLCEMIFFFKLSPYRTYHFPRPKFVVFLMPFLSLLAVWGLQSAARKLGRAAWLIALIFISILSTGYALGGARKGLGYRHSGIHYPQMKFQMYRVHHMKRSIIRAFSQKKGILLHPVSRDKGAWREYICTVAALPQKDCMSLGYKRTRVSEPSQKKKRFFFNRVSGIPGRCIQLSWNEMDPGETDVSCRRPNR